MEEKVTSRSSDAFGRLINSDFCDIAMALYYLCIKKELRGFKMLCKRLMEYDIKDMAGYVLQLGELYLNILSATSNNNLMYMNQSSAFDEKANSASSGNLSIFRKMGAELSAMEDILGRVICRLCSKNLLFSILMIWMLEANHSNQVNSVNGGESMSNSSNNIDESKHPEKSKKSVQININKCRFLISQILSSHICASTNYTTTYNNTKVSFVNLRIFLNDLAKISERLQSVDPAMREAQLHHYIIALNSRLEHGFFLPFTSFKDHIILLIHHQHSILLSSKDRVPFLVYIEVIETDNSNSNTSFKQHINGLFNDGDFTRYKSLVETGENFDTKKEDDKSDQVSLLQLREQIGNNTNTTNTNNNNNRTELWEEKLGKFRELSPYSDIPGWNIYPIIVKSGDDLRQDVLAYQLLTKCREIWAKENTDLYVKPYEVIVTSVDSGYIEVVKDAVSLHQIKNKTGLTLFNYFREVYGDPADERFVAAQKCFIKSLAAYSIFQYIFRLKDRHNSNILLDNSGHIVHIDFGFILGTSPKNLSFETSPFKMTHEYMELMNGSTESDMFLYFKSLMLHGFFALTKHCDKIMHLLEVMRDSPMACFGNYANQSIEMVRTRFHATLTDEHYAQVIDGLIYKSLKSYTTKLYDHYQYYTNGIL